VKLERSRTRRFEPNALFNQKLSLFAGSVTTLQVDAIVNAANALLLAGGGGTHDTLFPFVARCLMNDSRVPPQSAERSTQSPGLNSSSRVCRLARSKLHKRS